jgi:hypothetical protein
MPTHFDRMPVPESPSLFASFLPSRLQFISPTVCSLLDRRNCHILTLLASRPGTFRTDNLNRANHYG